MIPIKTQIADLEDQFETICRSSAKTKAQQPKLPAVVGHQYRLGGIQMNPAKSINSITKEHSHAHC